MFIIILYFGLGITLGTIWATILNSEIEVTLLTGIVAGVIGTLVMDILNFLFARAGIITK